MNIEERGTAVNDRKSFTVCIQPRQARVPKGMMTVELRGSEVRLVRRAWRGDMEHNSECVEVIHGMSIRRRATGGVSCCGAKVTNIQGW